MEEFGGNTYSGMPYQAVVEKLSSQTVPLLERRCLSTNPDSEIIEESFNLLNYEYWIFGDRRFLISRKRTDNLGDLGTKWRSSMIRASFDWANNPTSIMIAQAAQEYNDKQLAKEMSYEALQARFN